MTLRMLRAAIVSAALSAIVLGLCAAPSSAAVSSTPVLGWYPNAPVHAMAIDGNWIYLGGTFTSLTNANGGGTMAAQGLVRLSRSTGSPDTTWKPTTDGDVRAMAIDASAGRLYLGGAFTHVSGAARNRLAAVSTSGTGAVAGWAPSANSTVRGIVVVSTTSIIVAGQFTNISGSGRQHVALISNTGALNASFKPTINQNVYAVSRPSGANFVVIGGLFTAVGGVPHRYIAAISTTTGAPTSYNAPSPCPSNSTSCPVIALVTTASRYYAGAGGPGGRVVSYSATTGARQFTVTADGDCQALALSGDELFVGGHFGPDFGGATRYALAGVNATTGALDGGFAPSARTVYPGVWAMAATSTALYVGGDLTRIGGTADSHYAQFRIT